MSTLFPLRLPDTLINLERMVCGYLHLSTAVIMFSDPKNVSSLEEFVRATVKVRIYHNTLCGVLSVWESVGG